LESRVPWKRASSSSAPRLCWRWWWRRRRLPMQGATARHRHGAKLWFLRPRRRRTKSPNAGGKGARKRRETAPGARLRVATLTDLAGMAACRPALHCTPPCQRAAQRSAAVGCCPAAGQGQGRIGVAMDVIMSTSGCMGLAWPVALIEQLECGVAQQGKCRPSPSGGFLH